MRWWTGGGGAAGPTRRGRRGGGGRVETRHASRSLVSPQPFSCSLSPSPLASPSRPRTAARGERERKRARVSCSPTPHASNPSRIGGRAESPASRRRLVRPDPPLASSSSSLSLSPMPRFGVRAPVSGPGELEPLRSGCWSIWGAAGWGLGVWFRGTCSSSPIRGALAAMGELPFDGNWGSECGNPERFGEFAPYGSFSLCVFLLLPTRWWSFGGE